MNILKLLIRYMLIFSIPYTFDSCRTIGKRMSSSEYYDYLRKDTSICELPTLVVASSFKSVLDTTIKSWKECSICKKDPHPFVFEINEKMCGDSMIYTVKTVTNTKLIQEIDYSGAFTYNEFVFVVLEKSHSKSYFRQSAEIKPTKIYFCGRIYSSRCGLLVTCKFINDRCEINIECPKKNIIMIR